MLTIAPLICRVYFNTFHDNPARQNGWSIRLPMLETNWPVAFVQAQQMVAGLRNIMAKDVRIEYAALGQAEMPWIEQALIGDRLTPLPQWGYSETDTKGLWWDFFDGQGEAQGHLFRAIAQDQFVGTRWSLAKASFPSTIPDLPLDLTTATPLQLFQHCFATLRSYAAISRKIGPRIDGVQQYKVTPVQTAQFVRTSSRRVGYPWHRLSWEAMPWTSAPPFSPCGMVVGVGRGCFLVRAIFYPGGPTQWIHYYAAPEDAQVFPLPHIWWGRFGEQDLYNSFDVGELTGNTRRTWATCLSYGHAAGDHYSGPEEGFRGLFLPTWTPVLAPPADLLPACDNPGTKGGDIEYGGFGIGGRGIMWDHLIGSAGRFTAIDSYLVGRGEESMDIDSLIAEEGELTPEFDSLVAIQSSQILKLQSVIANPSLVTLGIASSLRKTQSLTLGIDSYLQPGTLPDGIINVAIHSYNATNYILNTTSTAGTHLFLCVDSTLLAGDSPMPCPAGWTELLRQAFTNGQWCIFALFNNPGGLLNIAAPRSGPNRYAQVYTVEVRKAAGFTAIDKLAFSSGTAASAACGPTAALTTTSDFAWAAFRSSANPWNTATFLPTGWSVNSASISAGGVKLLTANTALSSSISRTADGLTWQAVIATVK